MLQQKWAVLHQLHHYVVPNLLLYHPEVSLEMMPNIFQHGFEPCWLFSYPVKQNKAHVAQYVVQSFLMVTEGLVCHRDTVEGLQNYRFYDKGEVSPY